MDTASLYREEILEHYQDPQNFGRPSSFDVSSKQTNPLCGDEIEMFVKFDSSQGAKQKHPPGVIVLCGNSECRCACRRKEIIGDVGFIGKGCVLTIAGASLLTHYVKGKEKKELTNFVEEDMLALLGIEVSQTRKKCILLPLAVLKECLEENSKFKAPNFK